MRKNTIELSDKVGVAIRFVYQLLYTNKYDEIFNGELRMIPFENFDGKIPKDKLALTCLCGVDIFQDLTGKHPKNHLKDFSPSEYKWWKLNDSEVMNKIYDDKISDFFVEVSRDVSGFIIGVSYSDDEASFLVNSFSYTYMFYNKGGYEDNTVNRIILPRHLRG